jgi:hypothetical protein
MYPRHAFVITHSSDDQKIVVVMCALGQVGVASSARQGRFSVGDSFGNEAKFLNYFQPTSNLLTHALTRTRSSDEQKDVLLV